MPISKAQANPRADADGKTFFRSSALSAVLGLLATVHTGCRPGRRVQSLDKSGRHNSGRALRLLVQLAMLSTASGLGLPSAADAGSTPSCQDSKGTTWCQKKLRLHAHKCQNTWMQTNCALTCGQCVAESPPPASPSPPPAPPPPPCHDTTSTTWCQKKTEKCDRPWFQRNCAQTCGQCPAEASPPPPSPNPPPPATTPGSPPPPPPSPLSPTPCQDTTSTTWCQKKTHRCDEPWFQRSCARTCGQCPAEPPLPSPPPSPPSSPPPCEDIKSTQWCEKKKDKCEARPYVQTNCAMTCGQCVAPPPPPAPPCADIQPTRWCEKRTDRCEEPWYQSSCAETCGQCADDPPVDLCLAETYFEGISQNLICDLWLDAGHSCSTKWEDVCANDHPGGPEQNAFTLASVSCSQCPVDLCAATTYFEGISENLICDLWIDAGHNCDTQWDSVCTTDNPSGAEYNSGILSSLDCELCGGGGPQTCSDEETAVNSQGPCDWAPCNQNEHFECSSGNHCYAGNADPRCDGKDNGHWEPAFPPNTWCWGGNLDFQCGQPPAAMELEGQSCSSSWTNCEGCTSTGDYCGTPSGARGESMPPSTDCAVSNCAVVCGMESCAPAPGGGHGPISVSSSCGAFNCFDGAHISGFDISCDTGLTEDDCAAKCCNQADPAPPSRLPSLPLTPTTHSHHSPSPHPHLTPHLPLTLTLTSPSPHSHLNLTSPHPSPSPLTLHPSP